MKGINFEEVENMNEEEFDEYFKNLENHNFGIGDEMFPDMKNEKSDIDPYKMKIDSMV